LLRCGPLPRSYCGLPCAFCRCTMQEHVGCVVRATVGFPFVRLCRALLRVLLLWFAARTPRLRVLCLPVARGGDAYCWLTRGYAVTRARSRTPPVITHLRYRYHYHTYRLVRLRVYGSRMPDLPHCYPVLSNTVAPRRLCLQHPCVRFTTPHCFPWFCVAGCLTLHVGSYRCRCAVGLLRLLLLHYAVQFCHTGSHIPRIGYVLPHGLLPVLLLALRATPLPRLHHGSLPTHLRRWLHFPAFNTVWITYRITTVARLRLVPSSPGHTALPRGYARILLHGSCGSRFTGFRFAVRATRLHLVTFAAVRGYPVTWFVAAVAGYTWLVWFYGYTRARVTAGSPLVLVHAARFGCSCTGGFTLRLPHRVTTVRWFLVTLFPVLPLPWFATTPVAPRSTLRITLRALLATV